MHRNIGQIWLGYGLQHDVLGLRLIFCSDVRLYGGGSASISAQHDDYRQDSCNYRGPGRSNNCRCDSHAEAVSVTISPRSSSGSSPTSSPTSSTSGSSSSGSPSGSSSPNNVPIIVGDVVGGLAVIGHSSGRDDMDHRHQHRGTRRISDIANCGPRAAPKPGDSGKLLNAPHDNHRNGFSTPSNSVFPSYRPLQRPVSGWEHESGTRLRHTRLVRTGVTRMKPEAVGNIWQRSCLLGRWKTKRLMNFNDGGLIAGDGGLG